MNRAGQETFIMNLFKNIDRSSTQFAFLCMENRKGDLDDEIEALGGKIYHLKDSHFRSSILKRLYKILQLVSFFRKHREINVYHIHNYHALDVFEHLLASKLCGVKKVVVHSHNSEAPRPVLHKVFRKINNLFHYDKFACSTLAANWLFGPNATRNGEVAIIKNGTLTQKYTFDNTKRNRIRKELGISDALVIGHIGRFNQQKNHQYLIKVFQRIYLNNKNAILLLVGVGELEKEIEKTVNEYGLHSAVKFLGLRTDIPELLSGMDLFLFPSLYEGFSMVLVEAQANGLPCIISDTQDQSICITDLVHTLPIDSEYIDKWVSESFFIIKKDVKRENYALEIKNKGYDFADIAKDIQNYYYNKI